MPDDLTGEEFNVILPVAERDISAYIEFQLSAHLPRELLVERLVEYIKFLFVLQEGKYE